MGLKHPSTINALSDYLVKEAKSKIDVDLARDDIVNSYADVPKQRNSCDCGVFLLHYVEIFLREQEPSLPDIPVSIVNVFGG